MDGEWGGGGTVGLAPLPILGQVICMGISGNPLCTALILGPIAYKSYQVFLETSRMARCK